MNFLEFWYQAHGAAIGIVVQTNNRPALIQKLYAARKESHDPDLAGLSLVQSPTDASQLWILHKRLSANAEHNDQTS